MDKKIIDKKIIDFYIAVPEKFKQEELDKLIKEKEKEENGS